jgi:ubiquinone/menaquinone biosynthesis C-methylase UbiE
MLQIAQEKTRIQTMDIDFMQMDLYHLDFPDNSFDGVFSMAAFEFIKDTEKAFNELLRVLKPGGKLLIGTIHKDSVWGKMYEDHARRDETSVFRNAALKTVTQLKLLDEKHLLATRGCVYIPPTTEKKKLTLEHESTLSMIESPGFILGLWRKE